MCDEDVFRVGGVAAQLGVEVGSAVAEAAVADNLQHGLCELEVVHRELVGVPAVLGVAAVGVDGTEHPVVHRHRELMLKGVAGEGRVVDLDVDLEVLVKPVRAEEADDCLGVHVVLVLGRLHRFRLDEERALESLGACIVACGLEHVCKVVLLPLHLGVEQAHVAFASSPEYIVGAAELDGGVYGVLDLYGCACHHIEVRVGCRSVHVAFVAEYVGGAPEELDVAAFHLFEGIVGDGRHSRFVFRYVGAFIDEVDVVEAEVLDAEFLHDFESCVHLVLGALEGVRRLIPGVTAGLAAELV